MLGPVPCTLYWLIHLILYLRIYQYVLFKLCCCCLRYIENHLVSLNIFYLQLGNNLFNHYIRAFHLNTLKKDQPYCCRKIGQKKIKFIIVNNKIGPTKNTQRMPVV